jgi:hypothetical protein
LHVFPLFVPPSSHRPYVIDCEVGDSSLKSFKLCSPAVHQPRTWAEKWDSTLQVLNVSRKALTAAACDRCRGIRKEETNKQVWLKMQFFLVMTEISGRFLIFVTNDRFLFASRSFPADGKTFGDVSSSEDNLMNCFDFYVSKIGEAGLCLRTRYNIQNFGGSILVKGPIAPAIAVMRTCPLFGDLAIQNRDD